MKSFLSFALLSLAMIGRLSAAQPETPSVGSAEFERVKTLVGTWKGKTDMGEGSMDFTVEYRLVSGGSVYRGAHLRRDPQGNGHDVPRQRRQTGANALLHVAQSARHAAQVIRQKDAQVRLRCHVWNRSEVRDAHAFAFDHVRWRRHDRPGLEAL